MSNKTVAFKIIVEDLESNFSAYIPDLPGCVATGDTMDEVVDNLKRAFTAHLAGILQDGDPIPTPRVTTAEFEYPL